MIKSKISRSFSVVILLCVVGLPLLFSFQNCSSGFSTLASESLAARLSLIQVKVDSSVSDLTNETSADFRITIVDPRRVRVDAFSSIDCTLDDGEAIDCRSLEFSAADLVDGIHMMKVKAKTTSGEEFMGGFSWTIDTAGPTITVSSVPPTLSGNRTNVVVADIFDVNVVDRVSCKLNDLELANCALPLTFTNQEDGRYTVVLIATDKVGNVSQSAPIIWQIDNSQPVLTLTSVPPVFTNVASHSISFTARSAVASLQTECSLNGGAYIACTSPFVTGAQAQGNLSFAMRAKNVNGSVSEPILTSWFLDSAPPVITVSSNISDWPLMTATKLDVIKFFPSVQDATEIQSVFCSVNIPGSEPQLCQNGYSVSLLEDGLYAVIVKATDRVGNVATVKLPFTIDRRPPLAGLVPISVAISAQTVCAITKGKQVGCGSSILPSLVKIEKVKSIHASTLLDSFCAVLEDDTVRCWGRNVAGILGTETSLNGLVAIPVAPAGLGKVRDFSMGAYAACAVEMSGEFKCWGGTPGRYKPVATKLEVGEVRSFAFESGGVAVQTHDKGHISRFIFGTTPQMDWINVNPQVETRLAKTSRLIGSSQAAATEDRLVTSSAAFAGLSKSQEVLTPLTIPFSAGVTQAAGSEQLACFIAAKGAYCFGPKRYEVTGYSSADYSSISDPSPRLVSGSADYIEMVGSSSRAVARDKAGRVFTYRSYGFRQEFYIDR